MTAEHDCEKKAWIGNSGRVADLGGEVFGTDDLLLIPNISKQAVNMHAFWRI